ncbi:MAG: MetQ/NlpA family ABC transporter substrate-binding protein [Desemzia incerta]|uniref:MetQ/NlpA family ABC transporter substrate-binding protein n=1 Tax=Desemzia incerta TaxID=82801 RepID=UPI0033153558
MKKSIFIKSLATVGAALLLAACGNSENAEDTSNGNTEETTIKIGASNTPHAEILEFAAPILEEEGVTLDISTYNDYVVPNVALDEGDLDANYFQHVPFFEAAVAENDYDFVNAGGIHLEPIGLFSQEYTDLSELPDGATILVSSNQSDWGRIIAIFQEAGLVSVDEGTDLTTATFDDITENSKNLVFEYENDPALMPTLYTQGEGDIVAINSNFAVDQGLNPLEDSIALESESSPYANIIAVRSEDKDNEAITKLVEVLRSQEVQDYILETWGGAVVPVTE